MTSNCSEGESSASLTSTPESRQNSAGQSLFSWAANRSSGNGPQKIRVTVLCARSLVKRDLFRLPDPFVKVNLSRYWICRVRIAIFCFAKNLKSFKVHVDGSGQSHATEVRKNTLDPKWNAHYDLIVGANDAITISVWNDKKVISSNSEQTSIRKL